MSGADGGDSNQPSVGALVRLALRGDTLAWGALVLILRPTAFRTARQWGLQDADADDVASDTMAVVFQKLAMLDDPEQAVAWTRRIARNKVANRRRRQREFAASDSGVVDTHRKVSPGFELRPDIELALAELPPRQREVVVLKVLGYSWAEIAMIQNVSIATARSRWRLADEKLEESLGGDKHETHCDRDAGE